MTQTKHLYVHIPFCHSICSYCDFVRFVKNDEVVDTYTDKVIKEIKTKCRNHKFKTIYVGGGTPNSLNEKQLRALLGTLNKYLDKDYEFTIECNPEYLTIQQSHILKANKVNRASIGVQTVNNTLLRKFHRQHTLNDVKRAITNLRKVGINNISLDFIYGFNELSNGDVNNAIKFIKNARIPHVS
jgi:oxygen-independent coproporphyrinogen-3 oxidase